MKKRKRKQLKKERLCIVVSSQTDARKEPKVINITRRSLIALICAAVAVIGACTGFAIVSVLKSEHYTDRLNILMRQAEEQKTFSSLYIEE